MRTRAIFTVFARTLESGRRVFYYQTYDEKGFRTPMYSTGQKTKTAAVAFCMGLYRSGKLIPQKETAATKPPLFSKFAEGWWDFETCAYLQKRAVRRSVSKGTAGLAASSTRAYLIPQFGGMRLDGITSDGIEDWLAGFKKRGLSNASGNTALMFLRIMLGEAKRKGLIAANPCDGVKSLPKEEKKIDILTPDEVRALFPADWREVWADETQCVLNKLAACTGMRVGEIAGLRGEYLFDGYISVAGQYGKYGYGDTKTHKERKIPIPKILEGDLLRLKGINGGGYLFSNDGGKTPLGRFAVYNAFFAALEKIGITKEERRKRNFSFHVWRHFFNTTMLMANVADSKVMSLTGHASKKMKERYTHFDTTKFSEVVDAQEKLLADKGAGKAKAKKK